MTNKEFYRDEIFEIACEFRKISVINGEPAKCGDGWTCGSCEFYNREKGCDELLREWLEQEYEEVRIQPEVKNLKQDDRVLVSSNGVDWIKRHFEKYDQEENVVYVYTEGATSWTEYQGSLPWKYAKLPEDESEAKPEIDWAKVSVDTKIFVKNNNDPAWYCRHFARYEHGKVYAWLLGKTSFTTSEEQSWDCAKLAEEKE